MNSLSLNQISNNILNILRGGRSSNDDIISLPQIKFLVKYYRSLLIRRDQERNLNRGRLFEQDLGHIVCSSVDSAESSSINSGAILIRTNNKIPTPIRLKNNEGITYVSCDDKVGEPLPVLDAQITYWQGFGKYTSDKPFAFYRDGYIYINNNVTITNIHVRGIFEDPEEVHEFTRANGLDLYDDNSPYPISSDMIESITKSIISGEGKIILGTKNDNELDRDSQ